MSHDIRTPLNGILGMTHIAKIRIIRLKLPNVWIRSTPRPSSCWVWSTTSFDMSKAESGKIELHPEPYYIDDFKSYIDSVIRPL